MERPYIEEIQMHEIVRMHGKRIVYFERIQINHEDAFHFCFNKLLRAKHNAREN